MNTVHTDLRGQNIGYNVITDIEDEVTIMIHNEYQLNTITWTLDQFKAFLEKGNAAVKEV